MKSSFFLSSCLAVKWNHVYCFSKRLVTLWNTAYLVFLWLQFCKGLQNLWIGKLLIFFVIARVLGSQLAPSIVALKCTKQTEHRVVPPTQPIIIIYGKVAVRSWLMVHYLKGKILKTWVFIKIHACPQIYTHTHEIYPIYYSLFIHLLNFDFFQFYFYSILLILFYLIHF